MRRVILLADMNSFFASCHQAVQPELEGAEVIVAGDPQKRTGIVLAASYPAKALGIRTGMPLWEAKQLCPEGYYFKPDYGLYMNFSTRILRIMRDLTDLIEPFSIDEAFADLTGVMRFWENSPLKAALELKRRIRSEAGVQCSVGLGPNKLIAKMAAGVQKPDGLTLVESIERFKEVFWPMPVRKLFGVGSRYEKHLRYYNVQTIGDLASFPVEILEKRWGKNGQVLWLCANGIDHSPVTPTSLDYNKSIGQQRTLPGDLQGFAQIRVVILELSEMVARRARQGGYVGKTVFLTLRDSHLNFLTRSASMVDYTSLPDDIYLTACRLLTTHWEETYPVRLVGVTLANLKQKDYEQYDLFDVRRRELKLVGACDLIRDRFGENAVFRGVSLTEASLNMKLKQTLEGI